VSAGLLIIAGILLFFGASFISGFDTSGSTDNLTGELVIDGLVNLAAAGLFIGGSVSMTTGNPSGRSLYYVAAGVVVVAAVYWAARWSSDVGGRMVYVVVFGALAVIGMSLASTSRSTHWLRHR
jgi:hypothetical protein